MSLPILVKEDGASLVSNCQTLHMYCNEDRLGVPYSLHLHLLLRGRRMCNRSLRKQIRSFSFFRPRIVVRVSPVPGIDDDSLPISIEPLKCA